jgi:hypothetical protein
MYQKKGVDRAVGCELMPISREVKLNKLMIFKEVARVYFE